MSKPVSWPIILQKSLQMLGLLVTLLCFITHFQFSYKENELISAVTIEELWATSNYSIKSGKSSHICVSRLILCSYKLRIKLILLLSWGDTVRLVILTCFLVESWKYTDLCLHTPRLFVTCNVWRLTSDGYINTSIIVF